MLLLMRGAARVCTATGRCPRTSCTSTPGQSVSQASVQQMQSVPTAAAAHGSAWLPARDWCVLAGCRKDATLKELGELLKDVVAEARKKYARLDFSLVYPDREGR